MDNARQKNGILLKAIAGLFPGYFALVMATGITSIGAQLLDLFFVAKLLLYVNVAAFIVLWAMLLVRLVMYFPRVRDDITDHGRGPGFFTVVAGTCVFGTQVLTILGSVPVALVMWIVGLVCWALIMYSFFTAVTVKADKPPLQKGISGAWLIATVATQSISVLGTVLAGQFGTSKETILFFTLCMFMIGSMIYLMLITLILYRFTFLDVTKENLTPPYWINMGAVAITTLAGARLILSAGEWPFLVEISPFLKGFTLFFWAAGTWWIPLLLILGFWRHVIQRFPLRYDPQYWGMVFPLGMYTVCTIQLSRALNFPPLMVIPNVFIYLAIAAWIAAFVGLVYTVWAGVFVRERNA